MNGNLALPGRREFGIHIHTAVFKMDNEQGPTVQHRQLCSVLCGRLDVMLPHNIMVCGRGELEGE